MVFSFFPSLAIAYWMGLQAWAGALWVPIFLGCMMFSRHFVSLFISPLEVVSTQRGISSVHTLFFFVSAWLGCTLYMAVYGYLIGAWAFSLGASPQEIRESLGLWSIPLGLANSAFVVTPDKPFVTDLGIIAANSYFYAFGLTVVYKAVHTILQRNRITQLAISDPEMGDSDDDL